MKKRSALIILSLVLALAFGGVSAYAEEEGVSPQASVDISTMFDVTIPTSLPVNIGPDGMVSTASDTRIYNNCENNQTVGVCKIDVKALNDWQLLPYHSEATADMEMDTKLASLYININGESAQTTAAGTEETIWSHPAGEIGKMYVGAGSSVPVTYDVEMGQRSEAIENLQVMTVTLTMDYVAPANASIPYDADNTGNSAYNDHWISSVNTGDYLYVTVPMLNTPDGRHPASIASDTTRFRIHYQEHGENRAYRFQGADGSYVENPVVDVTDYLLIMNPSGFHFGDPETNCFYDPEWTAAGKYLFEDMYSLTYKSYVGARFILKMKSSEELALIPGYDADLAVKLSATMASGTMGETGHRLYITQDQVTGLDAAVPGFSYEDYTDLEVKVPATPVWYISDNVIHEIQYVYAKEDIHPAPHKEPVKEGYYVWEWSEPVLEDGVYKLYADWQEDKSASLVFYDWDNKFLGALSVPVNRDVSAQVDAYVRNNFVHPSLRNASPASTARSDNYKGEYSEVVSNGAYWPLTDHIDYYFMEDPSKENSYAYGWADCHTNNYTFEDVWTTDGVGEGLSNVDFFDPSKGTDSVCILKACYKPGPDLVEGGNYTWKEYPLYGDETDVFKYTRANAGDVEVGSNEPICDFTSTLNRVTYINGKAYGVTRARHPYMKYTEIFLTPLAPLSNDELISQVMGAARQRHYRGVAYNCDPTYSGYDTRIVSPDHMEMTKQSMCWAMMGVLVDAAPTDGRWKVAPARSEEKGSQAADRGVGKSKDGLPIYSSNTLGYYTVDNDQLGWENFVTEGLETALGKESLARHGMPFGSLGVFPAELNCYNYMAADISLRFPAETVIENEFPDYWKTHVFSNSDLDPITQCIRALEDYIIENHPDQTDDTWWRSMYATRKERTDNHGSLKDGKGDYYIFLSTQNTNGTGTLVRVPRASYHQVVLYWVEWYDWYFHKDQDPASKPVPMSAAEADAIPLSACTLSGHAGLCYEAPATEAMTVDVSDTAVPETEAAETDLVEVSQPEIPEVKVTEADPLDVSDEGAAE